MNCFVRHVFAACSLARPVTNRTNCDTPIILVNFGNPWVGMFSRSPRFIHVCGTCRRSFRDESVKDMTEWMAVNMDEEVWPDFAMVWDRRVARGGEGCP